MGTLPSAQHLDQIRRKDGGERQVKETFVLLNTGNCAIYNILNICFGSSQPLLHSSLQPPKGIIVPRRSVIACTYIYVCDFRSLSEASICIIFTSKPSHIRRDNTLTLLMVKSLKLSFKEWHMKKQRIIIFKQKQIKSDAAIELPSASSPTSNCKE